MSSVITKTALWKSEQGEYLEIPDPTRQPATPDAERLRVVVNGEVVLEAVGNPQYIRSIFGLVQLGVWARSEGLGV